jgi:vacuolar-type H+-ATPase subunit E/Vma4
VLISYSENGESKQREATKDEAAYLKSAQDDASMAKEAEMAELAAKAEAKAALLDRLGITAEEATLLLG